MKQAIFQWETLADYQIKQGKANNEMSRIFKTLCFFGDGCEQEELFTNFEVSLLEESQKNQLISYFRARSMLFANLEPESLEIQMELLKRALKCELEIIDYKQLYQYLLTLKLYQEDAFQEEDLLLNLQNIWIKSQKRASNSSYITKLHQDVYETLN